MSKDYRMTCIHMETYKISFGKTLFSAVARSGRKARKRRGQKKGVIRAYLFCCLVPCSLEKVLQQVLSSEDQGKPSPQEELRQEEVPSQKLFLKRQPLSV